MTQTNKILITVLVGILLGGIITFVVQSHKNTSPTSGTSTSTASNASSTPLTSANATTSTSTGYTITQIPAGNVPKPIPDLNRPVTFGQSVALDANTRTLLTQKITTLQTNLKANPNNLAYWVQLGVDQKIAGDFTGSVISWEYANKLDTTNYVAAADLGDLYGYYLHDTAKAQIYYKQAISRGPTKSYLYLQFATFYRDVMKNNSQALVIVNQGLAKIPNDPSLLQLQSTLQTQ